VLFRVFAQFAVVAQFGEWLQAGRMAGGRGAAAFEFGVELGAEYRNIMTPEAGARSAA
jgi:hypothetical protein